jgi:hypothetical protein
MPRAAYTGCARGNGSAMVDPTTAGLEAESTQVAALLQIHCGYHLSEADPLRRYIELTHAQVLYAALVQAIRRERGKALADMIADGRPILEIAELTQLGSRQRVQALVRSGRSNGHVGKGDAHGSTGDGDQFEPAVGDVPGDDH